MAGGSKGLSHQTLKEDRISQLPDPLLTQILNHLPTEEAVRCSVLSTRWRTLWLWVPNLEFSFSKFPSFNAFVSFGDWFFDSDRVSCIDSLKLSIDRNDASYSYLTSWIDALVKRKIQHLYVYRTRGAYPHEMPLSLYVCESLVSLRLYRLTLVNAEFVSLPCLKILRLKDIVFTNEATFERLVSSCPVLEYLKVDVVSNDRNVYRVHSRSLKRFCLQRRSSRWFDYSASGLVIDAPLLCFLRIDDDVSESYTLSDLESNAKLDVSLLYGMWEAKRRTMPSFLTWISRVRDLTICVNTFQLIHRYSEFEQLPQFGYMSSLYLTLIEPYFKQFLIFLRSCPNLKSLILVMRQIDFSKRLCPKVMERVNISSVPECLLSSLEFVEFKTPICGLDPEMMLVWYFLENSPTLKKLTLRLKSHSTKDDFVKEHLKIPRGSTECEIVIL